MTQFRQFRQFRPMLAADAEEDYINSVIAQRGHLLASFKLDGIRAVIHNGQLLSRSLKPIPNFYTRTFFERLAKIWPELEGLDGELISELPYGNNVFARTSSAVMTHEGKPHITFHVFDRFQANLPDLPFYVRSEEIKKQVRGFSVSDCCPTHIRILPVRQVKIYSAGQLSELEEEALETGYEGLILRDPNSPYKFGRSTLKQAWMLKLKRFSDSEARITGFVELLHNANEAKTDELGLTKRGTSKEGKIPAGTLGALTVIDCHNPMWQFEIGTGFTEAVRREIWQRKEFFLNKIVKYKYLSIGMKDVPRHPVFLAFRSEEDL